MLIPYKTIRLEQKDAIGYLILNRPERLNTFNRDMVDEIRSAFRLIDRNDELRVLIITGAGQTFQAGADIAMLSKMEPEGILNFYNSLEDIYSAIAKLRQPVIAAINGHAMGSGLELAIACTLRVIAKSASVGLPEVKLGFIPGTGGLVRLPRIIGCARAAELVLTGKSIEAERAFAMGLVNLVSADGKVVEASEKLARCIIANAPVAVEMAKAAMEIKKESNMGNRETPLQDRFSKCLKSSDVKEMLTAFIDKRIDNL